MKRAILLLLPMMALATTSAFAQQPTNPQPLTPDAPPPPPDDPCSDGLAAGKLAQSKGLLREARKQYKACSVSQCLATTHDECAGLAGAVLDATPTIVVEARDRSGASITSDITVMVDEEVVAKELDGKSIAVDPGKHTITAQYGSDRVSQSITTQEGVKAMKVRLKFQYGFDPNAPVRDLSGHTIWPWALVAIGAAISVAGLGVVLTAPDLPVGCNDDTNVCVPLGNETPTSQALETRREEAGRSQDQPIIGYAVVGAGVLLAAGGLIWHFLEPVEPRTAGARKIKPAPLFAKGTGGGISLAF